jgi:copper homeostasis protein CutC
MAGGTVRAGSVEHLVAETGVREVHLGPTGGPAGDLDVAAVEARLALLTPRTVA